MSLFCKSLLPVFLLGALLLPAQAQQADKSFTQRVKDNAQLSGPVAAWQAIAQQFSRDPLFAALGLRDVQSSGGNGFRHSATFSLDGAKFTFHGTLKINPGADYGAPIASLLSVTTAPISGRLLQIGNLRAQDAKLDIVILNQGGGKKLYARVIPSYPNMSGNDTPFMMLSAKGKTVDFSLMGGNLRLENFIPEAKALPALNRFDFSDLQQTKTSITVNGKIAGKTVSVVGDRAQKSFTLTGSGLTLNDFISTASKVPALAKFSFSTLTLNKSTITVGGTINSNAVTVTQDQKQKTFGVTGTALKLTDFVANASKVPYLKNFSFTSFAYAPTGLTVAGKLGGKNSVIRHDPLHKTFAVTGLALALDDFVPAAAKVPFLKNFAYSSLAHTVGGIEVTGSVNGKTLSIKRNSGADSFSATGAKVELTDFLPEAASLSFLSKFSFTGFNYSPTKNSVAGTIDGKAVELTQTAGAKDFSVSGASLELTDFISAAATVPYLKNFTFAGLKKSATEIQVRGSVDGKAVSVTENISAKTFAIGGAALTLADFIPQVSQVDFLKTFAFNGLEKSAQQLIVTGTIDKKAVRVVENNVSHDFTVTGAALTLPDFVPSAAQVPFLSKFAFTQLAHSDGDIEVQGKIAGKVVDVKKDLSKPAFNLTGIGLDLADFIPNAANIPFLGKFAFDDMTRTDSTLTVSGKISGKTVTVKLGLKSKTFSLAGAGLTLTNFIPTAADVPFLAKFAFLGLAETSTGIRVSGTINGKAVSLTRTGKSTSFSLTGDDLKLTDFIPSAHGVPFLDTFAFEGLTRTDTTLTVSGKINGKAVKVVENSADKTFTATGADLALVDFIPEAASLPFLKTFAFDSLTRSATTLSVAGKIDGKAVSAVKNIAAGTFGVTGAALTLPDFVPASASLPFLKSFAFSQVTHKDGEIDVAGLINKKAVSVSMLLAGKTFKVTGADLTLPDFVPDAAQVPFLKNFAFDSLNRSATSIEVAGKIDAKSVSVVEDSVNKTFKVTGADLDLTDFVPKVSALPFLKSFAFDGLSYSAKGITVSGKIGGGAVSIAKSSSKPGFDVTGASLKLANFIPAVSQVSFLSDFAFDGLDYTTGAIKVAGKINGKSVAVAKSLSDKTFSVTGADLKLTDFIASAGKIPFLGTFAFDGFSYSPTEITVTGKIDGKSLKVVEDSATKHFSVTGANLTLVDFVPAAASLPFLKTFAFSQLTYSVGEIDVAGLINNKAVAVNMLLTGKTFKVTGADLTLPDFVPDAAKVPFLKNFAFDSLNRSATSIEVAGKINAKSVSVVEDSVNKTFKVTGADLELTDFVTQASALPFLKSFAFDSLSYSAKGITVSGKIGGGAVSIAKSLSKPGFDVTGGNLQLANFVPAVSKVSFLSDFAFDGLDYTAGAIKVAGKINGKSVAVAKSLSDKTFSVTGADLKLTDFIASAGKIPFLGTFAFDGFSYSPTEITVTGKIDGKGLKVVEDSATKHFSVTGADLTLPDFVPQSAQVPFLTKFAFDSLDYSPTGIDVKGKINGKALEVAHDLTKDSFSVTGDDLTLTDFVAEASKVTFLNKFAFDSLLYSPAEISISGKINNKAVSVVRKKASKEFDVTGADLKLSDFVASVAKVGFLDTFAFDSLTYKTTEITVTGKMGGKAISVDKTLGKDGSFTAKGDDLKLANIAPEAGGIKAFDKFALDLVSVSPEKFEVDGKLSGKAISFVKARTGDKKVTVTAGGLKLQDLFDPLASVPVLSAIAVDKVTLDGKSIEVAAEVNGDKIDVIAHVAKDKSGNYAALFFDTLDAATFIPAAKGHAVNDISLNKALFIIQPLGAPARVVTAKDLPGNLPSLVGWSSKDTLTLSGGVNIAAGLDVAASGKVADALKTIGIPPGELPLRGTLSAATFKAMGGKAKGAANALSAGDKKSLLAGLSITADIPLPKLPAIAGLVTLKGPAKLSINGAAQDASGPWAKLPSALSAMKPAGDLDMSIEFDLSVNGAGIKEDLDAIVSVEKGQNSGFSLAAINSGSWSKPFGIPGLTLTDGGFRFSLEESKGNDKEELAFFANAKIGKTNASVSADLVRANKKISLNFFDIQGKFGLQDFPGGKSIPNAKEFELDEVKISIHGIEAKSKIGGKEVDAFLFDAGSLSKPNWVFALDQKNFKLTELLPAVKSIKPLAAFTIPNAALILTEKGLSGNRSQMGAIAKDMFDDIFGKSNASVKIPSGIGILADFDAKSLGLLGEGLSKIGVHDDAIIMGGITGIFQGTPGIQLGFVMETPGDTHGLPKKMMSYKSGVTPEFFVAWSGEEIDAGLKIAMDVKAGKETLELATSIEIEFTEEGLGVKVLGEMDGKWKNPFGIHGLELDNLKMDASINDVGEVRVGFAGEEEFGNCTNKESQECLDIKFAVELSIALEDALPDGVAFKGSVEEFGIPQIIDVAETLLGLPTGGLADMPIPFFSIRKAMLAFATPGVTDPQLGLVSEGFAFGGQFYFMNKELGSVQGSGGPTSGFTFDGKIDDINLDILKFKNNNVDISVSKDPKFIINSEIDLLGAKQIVKLDIEPPHFEFDLIEKLGVFGEADITIRIDGFDLMKGTFDKNADISFVGVFKDQLIEWLEGQINKGLDELQKSATAKLEADKRSIDGAQKKVDGLNAQIAKIKAQDDAAKRRADASLESAKRRVRSLKGSYDHDIHEAHHCGHWYSHWACSPAWYIAAGATWLVYEAAEGALDAAEAIVAVAFDLDPRIAGLVIARDAADAVLAIAKAVVEAAEAVEKWVLHELKVIIDAILEHLPFEIEKAIIIGDLRGMIVNNDPMVFDMKFKMFGDEMHEYFAVKLPDSAANIEFDLVSFALLPAVALDKLTEDALKKVAPPIAKWLHAHIGAKIAEAEAKVRAEVEGEEAKFKDVLNSFDSGAAKYKSAYAAQAAEHQKLVSQMSITDLMPNSLEYKNTYLAVGHSSLCLSVSKDGSNVIQYDCKDNDAERWSTAKLKKGYVQLKNKGLCLKARKGGKTENFQPLILAPCNSKDTHEQWKIVSTDGFYDKIVNRFSQKCLHFNTENANPKSAFAVWTSCLGADSQQFRDIADAERPTWHGINSRVKSKSGLCLSVSQADQTKKWAPTKTDMEAKLYARSCDDSDEQFNYLEQVDGDIKLVHGDHGTCVYPQKGTNHMALRPCDTGSDMFWQVNAKGGSGFQLYNRYKKLCMMLPSPPKNSSQYKEAVLSNCSMVPGDGLLLDFVK
jgi:hypothetical protein